MDNRMAVRTHRPEVFDWVYRIFCTNFRQHPDVVDVYETFRLWSVLCLEIKTTDDTRTAVVGQTHPAGFWVPLISGHRHAVDSPFVKLSFLRHFSGHQFKSRSNPAQAFESFCQFFSHNPVPVPSPLTEFCENGEVHFVFFSLSPTKTLTDELR